MTTLSGQAMEEEAFFIVGGVVQRMPTIESLGSREVMSLATSSNSRDNRSNSLSRPPTRQTMSLFSEGSSSQPPSRKRDNNLQSKMILSLGEIERRIEREEQMSITTLLEDTYVVCSVRLTQNGSSDSRRC